MVWLRHYAAPSRARHPSRSRLGLPPQLHPPSAVTAAVVDAAARPRPGPGAAGWGAKGAVMMAAVITGAKASTRVCAGGWCHVGQAGAWHQAVGRADIIDGATSALPHWVGFREDSRTRSGWQEYQPAFTDLQACAMS